MDKKIYLELNSYKDLVENHFSNFLTEKYKKLSKEQKEKLIKNGKSFLKGIEVVLASYEAKLGFEKESKVLMTLLSSIKQKIKSYENTIARLERTVAIVSEEELSKGNKRTLKQAKKLLKK